MSGALRRRSSRRPDRSAFHAARDVDYAQIAEEARSVTKGLPSRLARDDDRRTDLEATLARMRKRVAEVITIDFFAAPGRVAAESTIASLERRLASRDKVIGKTEEGDGPLDPESYRRRTWVTRKNVHIDRIACAWLIRRFVDAKAMFKFVPGQGYRAAEGEVTFDMYEADFTHVGDQCSFETFVDRFGLRRAIIASTKLGDGPDYVRWVDATGELWVTEPDAKVIEVFTLPPGPKPIPAHAINIRVDGGPESLVIDSGRKRAYTHLWSGSTAAIDIASHQIVATWSNGCRRSRGIALDTQHGFLFAACAEGTLVVLDIDHNGKQLGSASSGSGVDVIAYSPTLAHVYFPGAGSATMAIVGVAASGQPTVLGTVPTASGAHCVAADDRGNAWVCDPEHGQLLVFKDAYPSNGIK